MKINLKFKNIVDSPNCRIACSNNLLYEGHVNEEFMFDVDYPYQDYELVIEHWGKLPSDTIVEDGKIVRDRSFEIEKIIIDGSDLEELVWESRFEANDGAVYNSCLFFGPNGKFIINLHNPVLYWILKTRHEKNNNDPHWEEDYNYYQQACNLLKQI